VVRETSQSEADFMQLEGFRGLKRLAVCNSLKHKKIEAGLQNPPQIIAQEKSSVNLTPVSNVYHNGKQMMVMDDVDDAVTTHPIGVASFKLPF
jgi:hypothetical protein